VKGRRLTDREFWQIVRRALLMVAGAIEKRNGLAKD
jgi:hypothetical protein